MQYGLIRRAHEHRMRRSRTLPVLAGAVSLGLAVVACGSSSPTTSSSSGKTTVTPTPTPSTPTPSTPNSEPNVGASEYHHPTPHTRMAAGHPRRPSHRPFRDHSRQSRECTSAARGYSGDQPRSAGAGALAGHVFRLCRGYPNEQGNPPPRARPWPWRQRAL